ncbi:hypothetical protein LDVICp052 [lymphocystis disease virus-China]|uniref:Uncharacterized protein n=1 Tax=lymphocystis disease virus-China TaxID=256729 RepID=Q678F9_9VIRU|nr:hypothetical protein LDVICp052 [lymphocystis disease virus-China]AAU10898.1 hypothetical protein [lymphocystis disease virus-China]
MAGFFLIEQAKGSIAIINNNGLRGQPCLIPFFSKKNIDCLSPVQTHAEGLSYINFTHAIKFSPKPNLFRVSNKYDRFKKSKAFSASVNIKHSDSKASDE